LAAVRSSADHYVTALKPSHHRAFLAEVADKLESVRLSTGEPIRALKTRRRVHGVEQTVVVTFSEKLYAGQSRGLDQSLMDALRKLARISPNPRGGVAGARERVARILNRQYVRQVLRCAGGEADGRVELPP